MLRSAGWPERYSVSTVVERNGFSGLRMASAFTTISCAVSAAAAAPAATSIAATRRDRNAIITPSHMSQRIDDLQSRGAIGGKECRHRRKTDQQRPCPADKIPRADHIELERHGLRLSRRQPGEPALVDKAGHDEGDQNARGRAHRAQQNAFDEKLPPDAGTAQAQC